jgi:3-oxoadipate enol-lactonase
MGGRIAMRTALLHPDRVATLTLVDTHEGFEAFSPEQRQAFVDSRRAPLLAGKDPRDIAEPVARSLVSPGVADVYEEGFSLEQLVSASTEAIERKTIVAVLDLCKGNITNAAKRLGLSRQSLHSKLKKYMLEVK